MIRSIHCLLSPGRGHEQGWRWQSCSAAFTIGRQGHNLILQTRSLLARARGDIVKGMVPMRVSARMTAGGALLLVLASTLGCAKLKARDQLVKGVQAFKAGRYEEAIGNFQN